MTGGQLVHAEEAAERQRKLKCDELPEVAVDLVAELVCQHDFDFVSIELVQQSVAQDDALGVPYAGEESVRLLGLLAHVHPEDT